MVIGGTSHKRSLIDMGRAARAQHTLIVDLRGKLG